MKHILNSSQKHIPVVHIRHDERAATADDCVACHIRAAHNMLARSGEILWALAQASDTSAALLENAATPASPFAGAEPPQLETCECFLTRKTACAVFDVEGNL